ncbi:MAG: hypothetical protein ACI97N_002551 [Cognaticolwellia sp.]|jgi:hypothetical protein
MKKITIRKREIETDVRYFGAEISSEDFPEILKEDFDINDCSDELHDKLLELDWEFLHDKAMGPDIDFSIKE